MIESAKADIQGGDYDLKYLQDYQVSMINGLLDVLHETTDRLRYISDRVDKMQYAFGDGYIEDVLYTGHQVDDIIFAPETGT